MVNAQNTEETEHLQTVASLADAPEGTVIQAAVKRRARLIQTRYLLANNDFLTSQDIIQLAQETTTFDGLIAKILETTKYLAPELIRQLEQGKVACKAIFQRLAKDPAHKEARYKAFSDIFDRFNNVPVQKDEPDLETHPTALTQSDGTQSTSTPVEDTPNKPAPDATPDR